jgi:hypothetical protein
MAAAVSLPIEVEFVQLGSLRGDLDLARLASWKSQFFRVVRSSQRDTLDLPDPADEVAYTDDELACYVVPQAGCIVFALVDAPLANGFYLRRLPSNRVIISVYEISAVVRAGRYSLQSFIFRNVYQIVVAHVQHGGSIPSSERKKLSHNQIAGCIFDWNANLTDIVNSLDSPTLCRRCVPKISGTPLEPCLEAFVKELRRIKKPGHMRHLSSVVDYVNAHPARALAFATAAALALNLAASVLFELAKASGWLEHIGIPAR